MIEKSLSNKLNSTFSFNYFAVASFSININKIKAAIVSFILLLLLELDT